jgi:hypothetical protein
VAEQAAQHRTAGRAQAAAFCARGDGAYRFDIAAVAAPVGRCASGAGGAIASACGAACTGAGCVASAARCASLSSCPLLPPIEEGIQPMMAAVPARQNSTTASAARMIIG